MEERPAITLHTARWSVVRLAVVMLQLCDYHRWTADLLTVTYAYTTRNTHMLPVLSRKELLGTGDSRSFPGCRISDMVHLLQYFGLLRLIGKEFINVRPCSSLSDRFSMSGAHFIFSILRKFIIVEGEPEDSLGVRRAWCLSWLSRVQHAFIFIQFVRDFCAVRGLQPQVPVHDSAEHRAGCQACSGAFPTQTCLMHMSIPN